MASTHFSKLMKKTVARTSGFPTDPFNGQEFFNTTDSAWYRYNGTSWVGVVLATTTSTSSSTTTTSTSTTTTSTSTSTTTTSTSTTTTSTSTSTTL